MRYFVLATASVLVVLGASAPSAMAGPENSSVDGGVDHCVGADTAAQSLRRDGKFGATRAELAMCVDASCPALVRDDCNQRLDELNNAQPTIVFDAKDDQGHDLVEVTVEVDGRPLAQRLEGIALNVDPGEHTFTFEAKGLPKMTRKFVLHEGEKTRRELIRLGAVAPPLGVSTPRVQSTPLGAQRVVALAALGVGLAGIGTSAAFALRAKAKSSDADAYCPGNTCTNDGALRMNHDARVAGDVATVALAVGAAGVAGAVVLWLTAKSSASSPSAEVAVVGNTLRVRGTW